MIRFVLLAGLIPLQLRKERERWDDAHLFEGQKTIRPRTVDILEGYDAPATGVSPVITQRELRNRYYTWDKSEPRGNAVALAEPVHVAHSGTSNSSLEQEILDRQRRVSTAPLISRY